MEITSILLNLFRRVILLSIILLVLLINSCQEDGLIPTINDEITAEYLQNREELQVYLDHEQVLRLKGEPGITPIPIGGNSLYDYEACFILYITNGSGSEGTVSSAVIKLDGQVVLSASDFSNISKQYEFEVCNLSSQSQLEVEVKGTPGSFVDIWMEGKPKNKGTFTDERDGHVYKWVKIGDQVWMAENLAAIQYNDGSPIPSATNVNGEWERRSTEAYGWCGTDQTSYIDEYGAFYNWYAVNTKKLCPIGWHVPTDTEWNKMIEVVGGPDLSGVKLKSTGTLEANTGLWLQYPGIDATDEYGFTALPAGSNGHGIGNSGYWWTITEQSPDLSYYHAMHYCYNIGDRGYQYKEDGYSVRCVKTEMLPTEGLVAYFPLNGNLYDESGNGLNLTEHGDPTLTADRHGISNSAYSFNGTTDYLSHEGSELLMPTDNFTINIWFYNSGVDGEQDVLITTLTDFFSLQGGYFLGLTSSDIGRFKFVFTGTDRGTMSHAVEGYYFPMYWNEWTMVTSVYTPNELKLYVNGNFVAKEPHDGHITYEGTNSFMIGTCLDVLNSDRMFKGSIDDVRLYNRALSLNEISALFSE